MHSLEAFFGQVREINAWLDRENGGLIDASHDDAMRVMKIGEEYGEAVQAYIGMTGQNPRKGVTHSLPDVLAELADVVVTGLAAIQHFTGDDAETMRIMLDKLDAIRDRIERQPVAS